MDWSLKNILNKLKRSYYRFKNSDPIKNCPKYLKDGCSLVDGPWCTFPDCNIIRKNMGGSFVICSECKNMEQCHSHNFGLGCEEGVFDIEKCEHSIDLKECKTVAECYGYKGFNSDMTCRDFKYELGRTYKAENDSVEVCMNGFHFCRKPMQPFFYYTPSNWKGPRRYCSVYGRGKMDLSQQKTDGKVCCSEIEIRRELDSKQLIDRVRNSIKKENIVSNTNQFDCAISSLSEHLVQSDASHSVSIGGSQSLSEVVRPHSCAVSVCDYSIAHSENICSSAVSLAHGSMAVADASASIASTLSTMSHAIAKGLASIAVTTSMESTSTVEGENGVAIANGTSSSCEALHMNSIAVVNGIDGKARGVFGSWLVFVDLVPNLDNDLSSHKIQGIKAVMVDGDDIKEMVWYKYEDGCLCQLPTAKAVGL